VIDSSDYFIPYVYLRPQRHRINHFLKIYLWFETSKSVVVLGSKKNICKMNNNNNEDLLEKIYMEGGRTCLNRDTQGEKKPTFYKELKRNLL